MVESKKINISSLSEFVGRGWVIIPDTVKYIEVKTFTSPRKTIITTGTHYLRIQARAAVFNTMCGGALMLTDNSAELSETADGFGIIRFHNNPPNERLCVLSDTFVNSDGNYETYKIVIMSMDTTGYVLEPNSSRLIPQGLSTETPDEIYDKLGNMVSKVHGIYIPDDNEHQMIFRMVK